jgi:CDP-glycerol glycerophosphotransferase (TagB/SpsB family)
MAYHIAKRFKKKPLWIISDRPTVANDNGEAFFRYMADKNPKGINFEFVINKDCPDAKRMKKIGKVVYFDSFKYKMHFLLADKLISSQANDFVLNAFTVWENRYIRDIANADFVFLQHGITKDDLSPWLNKRNKKIDLFITAARDEHQSILDGYYGLDESKVALTGFSRFDRLYNQKSNLKKQVLIMPTWRRSISQSYDKDNNSVYYDKFNETEYFKFFNNLINDERVLSVMREKGYTGKFALHPIHAKQIVDYQENDVFTTVKGKINYQELFSESALMITDFSSTFFDFCYLEKPIIYAQFDKEDFYAGQIYNEGYFGYEKNGFGPVCETYEDTVNTLINSINNDCVLDSEYEKRIKDFYAFNDNQNCQRIFDAIVNMDK